MEWIFGFLSAMIAGAASAGAAVWFMRSRDRTVKASEQEQERALQDARLRVTTLETTLNERERQLENIREQLNETQSRLESSTREHTRAQSEINHLTSKLDEQKQWINQAQEQFTHQFQTLAQRILDEKSARFTEQNKQQVGQLIEPLRENLKRFHEQIEQMRRDGKSDHGSLIEQIKQLTNLNQHLSRDAQNLTLALKGQNKVAGNWGEMILEQLLERSGLTRDQEFTIQESFKTESGNVRFTDVVIHLPGERHLVVDSKVSLENYEQSCNAEDESVRERAFSAHIASLKNHISDLSEKSYQNLAGMKSPDFVMLFVPIEPALHVALQREPSLFDHAFARKVVLVSPTTLLATLKTVANIWRIEKQNRNTEEIARLGGTLHDKFVGFLGDMEEIGTRLRQANLAHEGAMNKLTSGSGNLVRKAQQLVDLGAKARKQLDSKYLDEPETDRLPDQDS